MKPIKRVDVNMEELEALLDRAKAAPLSDEDYAKLKGVVETLGYLTNLLEDRKTTIQRLRQILFGASTEKTRNVLNPDPQTSTTQRGEDGRGERASGQNGEQESESDNKPKGHGRNGAASYTGATKIKVCHESLKPGDCCPKCRKGKVYASVAPGFLVRIVGQAPMGAKVYEIEKLRCNLCLEVFTARTPDGVGEKKYDETSGSMIALLKYGSGVPFYRLEHLQGSMGIPLPASTQWEIAQEVAGVVEPAFRELIRQAAQGKVLHNDDTTMKILALMKEEPVNEESADSGDDMVERTGIFTSGIVSTGQGHQIALFFTGRKHAGENLADVLRQRASDLGPPIQMCDALSRNVPKELEVVLANCIAHGRRQFVDVAQTFPDECRYVLETLAKVYRNDELAREEGMSPEERLRFHQERSGPLMEGFENWLKEQIAERKVEPNSGLGKAISYFKNHFKKLTLFLHAAGAPLDNNICERALKKAILHRKNALFFKTENGAHVSDIFMSLICTCQLCGADPFHYLTELQKHATDLKGKSQEWMPWNYRDALQPSSTSPKLPDDRASPHASDRTLRGRKP
jgi:transposase